MRPKLSRKNGSHRGKCGADRRALEKHCGSAGYNGGPDRGRVPPEQGSFGTGRAKTLSVDTTLALIDAGYTAAIVIDQETGAVTLNKEAYIAIAKPKLTIRSHLWKPSGPVCKRFGNERRSLMATELGKSITVPQKQDKRWRDRSILQRPNCSAESAEKIHWELSGSSLVCGQDQCGGISNGQDTSGKDLETFRD